MQIAGVKALRDGSIGRVQNRGFLLHHPIARQLILIVTAVGKMHALGGF
jgi:hypothetical protein